MTIACTLSTPCSCCVMPIDHTSTADSACMYMRAKRSMSSRDTPDKRSRSSNRASSRWSSRPSNPLVCSVTNSLSIAAHREQHLEHAVAERDVAAGVDAEELVGDLCAEHRALDVRRHPVALEPRFAQRIHDRDPRAPLLGEVQVLHEHGLGVGDVGPEQHDEVAVDHVAVGARRRGDADRILQRVRRRRVAHACRVVDVVGADEPGRLLRGVVHLVGDTAGGQVDADAVGFGDADAIGHEIERVVPRERPEPGVAAVTHHRRTEPAQLAQLAPVQLRQRGDVGEPFVGDRGRGVDLQQFQARRAQVHAGDRPVVEAGNAERASVAHALAQDAPRKRQVAPVVPHGRGHVAVVMRLLLSRAIRLPPDPEVAPRPLRRADETLAAAPHVRRRRCVRDACTR